VISKSLEVESISDFHLHGHQKADSVVNRKLLLGGGVSQAGVLSMKRKDKAAKRG